MNKKDLLIQIERLSTICDKTPTDKKDIDEINKARVKYNQYVEKLLSSSGLRVKIGKI